MLGQSHYRKGSLVGEAVGEDSFFRTLSMVPLLRLITRTKCVLGLDVRS